MELSAGSKQTAAGTLPADWNIVPLDRLAKRGSGHTPDKKRPDYWNGSIKWVSLADSPALDRLYINETVGRITPAGVANSSAVVHPAGTVILSRDAGVGKSAILRTQMAVSQHFMAWCCGPELDNRYLYHVLQAAKPEFERIANGTTIKTIGVPFFRELQIAQPPLAEQQAIADALCDVDVLLEGLTQLIAKKRDLKQATMQQFLTGHTRLPGFRGTWGRVKIGDIADCTAGGTPSTRVAEYWDGPIRWMNSGDLHQKRVNDVAGRITEAGLLNSSAVMLPPRSILVGLAGQGRTRGTVAMNMVDLCTNQSIAAVLPNPAFFAEYLFYNLDSRYDELRKMSTGAGGRGALNLTIIKAIEVLLPSIDEQVAIATVLSDMDTEISVIEARRDKTRALKQAMMQELLTGRTRLVEPESAHA